MLIKIKASAAGAAAAQAMVAAQESLKDAEGKFFDECYAELLSAATRNGYNITDSVKEDFKKMAERDTEQLIARHPAKTVTENMVRLVTMCAYMGDGDVYLDELDFEHLKEHLSPK